MYLLAAAVGTAAVTASLAYVSVSHRSSSSDSPTAAIPVSLPPSESSGGAPSELRRAIVASTYRELARYGATTGQLVSVFSGVGARDGSSCWGLTIYGVSSLSCPKDTAAPLRAGEFTVTGHKMVGGVVSDLIDKVVVTDVGGSDVPLEIRNGTFFFDGGQGRSVVAYDGAGQIVGSYDLQGPGG